MNIRQLTRIFSGLAVSTFLVGCNGATFVSMFSMRSGSSDLNGSPSVMINSGSLYTNSSLVKLSFTPPENAFQMMVTNNPDCGGPADWQSFSRKLDAWALSQKNSSARVFAKFKDLAGNESSCISDEIVHDSIPPVASLASEMLDLALGSIRVTVSFSEEVFNFSESAIVLANASLKRFNGKGSTYTFDVTPRDQGLFSVSVGSDLVHDAAGNKAFVSNNISKLFDTISPNVVLTSVSSNTTRGAISVVATFSEPVIGFSSDDVSVTNGSIKDFSGQGAIYTFLVTPSVQGEFSVSVTSGVVKDEVGNANNASNELKRIFDLLPPSVVLSSAASGFTNDKIRVVATFDEPVDGFTANDLSVSNCTVSEFTAVENKTFEFTVTPSAEGAFSVFIPQGVASDGAGNLNSESNSLSRNFDSISPAVTLAVVSIGSGIVRISAVFSESVTGLMVPEVLAANAAVENLTGSGQTYQFDVKPAGTGALSVSIPEGVTQDISGNGNKASNIVGLMPPAVPRSIQVDFINTSSARVDWLTPSSDGGASISEYIVYFSSDAGKNWTRFTSVLSSGSLSSTVDGLSQGLNYVFGVSAKNMFGEGDRGTSQNLNLKKFEPVLAVRAMGCINCHATGSSIVTDFGKGDVYQMNGYYSGNHHSSEGWALSSFSKITVPTIPSRSETNPNHPYTINMSAVAQPAQDACESGQHQEFFFELVSDGSRVMTVRSDEDYRIKSVYSGLAFHAPSPDDGRETYFYPADTSNNFKWRLEGNAIDGYQLKSHLDLNKCVVAGVGTKDRWDGFKVQVCNAASKAQKFILTPGLTPQAFQVKPMHNTNPNGYCLEVPGGDYADPKEAIRRFILKRSRTKNPNVAVNVLDKDPFIGAPDRSQLLQHLNSVNSTDDWFYRKNKSTSVSLNTNPTDKANFYEISGDLSCDGDLAFKKPLVIKNLHLTTLNGCRLYVVGQVFLQGAITYSSLDLANNRTNLQIISSDFISMGIGTNHCETEGGFWWYKAAGIANPLSMRLISHSPELRANYFADKQGYYDSFAPWLPQVGLEDASCRFGGDPVKTNFERRNLSFERLMMVAPMIQSRYIGDFKGVLVAEFVNFTLGQFRFDFHEVFKDSHVPVLPLVPSAEFLKID